MVICYNKKKKCDFRNCDSVASNPTLARVWRNLIKCLCVSQNNIDSVMTKLSLYSNFLLLNLLPSFVLLGEISLEKSSPFSCECGRKTDEKSRPWMVFLDLGEKRGVCSGSFVSQSWFLTAAHCFCQDRQYQDCDVDTEVNKSYLRKYTVDSSSTACCKVLSVSVWFRVITAALITPTRLQVHTNKFRSR